MKYLRLTIIGLCLLFLFACDEEEAAIDPDAFKEKALVEESKGQPPPIEQETDEENVDPVDMEAENDILAEYLDEEIEHARVWLQLGANKEIEELYVVHIREGELLNPNIESSARYPEDVIQLSGSRFIDGSVTYSTNGDGTINVYHVPLRWEENTPDDFDEENMKIFTESIVKNPELIELEQGDAEDIKALIEKIKNPTDDDQSSYRDKYNPCQP